MKKIGILLLFAAISGGLASEGDGGYAGAFLRMGMGARAKAMGDAFTAIPEDAIAAFYNPALLPHLKTRQALVSFAFLPLDRKLDYIGYAQALQPRVAEEESARPLRAGFSVAWVHAGVDQIDGRDMSGNHIGYFSNSEHAFYLSFALSPAQFLSVGISGKVLYNRFPKIAQEDKAITSRGFGMDIGAFVTPFTNLMIGVTLKDNLSKYTWNTDKLWDRGTSTTYQFPRVLRSGVAYRIPQEWLLVAFDVEQSKLQNPRYHFGMEFSYPNIGALRLGIDHDRPTMGVGFFAHVFGKNVKISYGFVDQKEAPGSDHIFSWSFDL